MSFAGKYKTSWKAAGIIAWVLLCGFRASHAGVIYDLQADWSDANNPNDEWSYNQAGAPLPFHAANWAGVGADGWTTGPGIVPPAVLQVNSLVLPNVAVGDIITHSTDGAGPTVDITWTAPAAGIISISGQAWDVQHSPGRDDLWTLSLGVTELARRNSILGVVKNSAAADFANNLNIGQSLVNLAVAAGDLVTYLVRETTGDAGHFSGVGLTIDFTANIIPAPASFLSMLLTAAPLLLIRRRRKTAR